MKELLLVLASVIFIKESYGVLSLLDWFHIPWWARSERVKRETVDLMTPKMKQDILDFHISSRRDEEAANMEYMYWHDGLEEQARAWAIKCDYEHGGNRGGFTGQKSNVSWQVVGQNLGVHSSSTNPLVTAQKWYNEKIHYGHGDHSCGEVCGHYTQVVWAKSKYLGCAFVRCTPLYETSAGKPWGDGNYLVCHCGPPGNLVNTRPYLKGEVCSRCQSGSFCDKGLCRNCEKDDVKGCECKADCENCGTVNSATCHCVCKQGFLGQWCEKTCGNHHPYCGKGWYKKQCSTDFVFEHCPLMCDICNAPDGSCQKAPTTIQTVVKNCSTSMTCLNGGTSQTLSTGCACSCKSEWSGQNCQYFKKDQESGVLLKFNITSDTKWDDMWKKLRDMLPEFLNEECRHKSGCRCKLLDRFVLSSDVTVGEGYPDISATSIRVLIFISGHSCTPASEDPSVPKDILFSALAKARTSITTELTTCCTAKLLSIEKGVYDEGSKSCGHLPSTATFQHMLLVFVGSMLYIYRL